MRVYFPSGTFIPAPNVAGEFADFWPQPWRVPHPVRIHETARMSATRKRRAVFMISRLRPESNENVHAESERALAAAKP
jgi:hypothetical protein